MKWQALLFAFLSASLLRPVLLAGAAWIVLRLFRVRHPASRHAVWATVLAGMLVLPVLSVVSPQWKLPLLPATYEIAVTSNLTSVAPYAVQFDSTVPFASGSASHGVARFEWPPLETIVVGCWLVGFIAMLVYRLAGVVMLRRVLSRSRSIRGGRMRESDDVFTPVAVRVLRPCVLLPAGWRAWNIATKRAVLAHEFAHLRRRDTLVAALARFAKCVFWFHALVWWISRHVADLAELSCDAAALDRTRDPEFYSHVLLSFASIVKGAGRRSALPGLAMASGSGMGPRIDFIYELSAGGLRKLSRPGILVAAAGLPIACFAAVVGLRAPVIQTIVPPAAGHPMPERVLLAQAQAAPVTATPVAPRPEFDAVSVKRCLPGDVVTGAPGGGRSGGTGRGPRISPGRLRMQCLALRSMIQFAYLETSGDPLLNRNIPPDDGSWVKGGPPWIDSDWYTVDAETNDPVANGPGDGPNSAPWKRMGQMLQVVLEDRFQLKLHRETEEVPMYSLVVAKGGLKLNPMEKGGCIPHDRDSPTGDAFPTEGKPLCAGWGHIKGPDWVIDAAGQPLSTLAGQLSNTLNRHVFDKTGANGVFIYHLEFAHDDTTPGSLPPEMMARAFPASDDPPGPSIFSELEKLGLKLEPTKGPRGVVVIDHVERPSAN